MKTKFELYEINGYPEFIPHIIDVSEVLDLRYKDAHSCGFTVILDDFTCLNIFHEYSPEQLQGLMKKLSDLREQLISAVKLVNPSFIPHTLQEIPRIYSSNADGKCFDSTI
ncbi:MAG: hypothetical protein RBS43_05115 [Candidatus Cloacimonas sp.]|jgi:hypothetical protein|nr:hypothetical protein [Candidatus Cloacimonas sp.]